jgi:hypothetical protein
MRSLKNHKVKMEMEADVIADPKEPRGTDYGAGCSPWESRKRVDEYT